MKSLDQCSVLVTPTSYASQDPSLTSDLESRVGVVEYNRTGKPLSSSQLQELLPGVDGMIAGLDEIDDRALAAADELKVVSRYGVGVNNVDLQSAKRRGITVTNTPGANSKAVAELCVALILLLVRSVMQAALLTGGGDWPRFPGYSLEGKTTGLLGLGAIGREVVRRLQGFDCSLLAHDINEDAEFAAQFGVRYVSLEELLAESDVLSLHVPGTPETLGMVDDKFLMRIKEGAWLVNTARGDLIDEAALARALESGRLQGAALDVFQHEPPRHGNPLLSLENVILTPHMGAHVDSAVNRMGRMALDDCLRVLMGEEPVHKVV